MVAIYFNITTDSFYFDAATCGPQQHMPRGDPGVLQDNISFSVGTDDVSRTIQRDGCASVQSCSDAQSNISIRKAVTPFFQ
jgi:hypothetical protein